MTTSTDDVDVVDILTTDHEEVLELIGEIASADPAGRRDMIDTVIAELMRHSVAEEMYVYPAMRKHLPDGDAAVEHDVKEHQELEEAMKVLESADTAEPAFLDGLSHLEAILRDHVEDEERDQFPQLRSTIPHDELVAIGKKVETAKKLAPTRPHPAAPHSALFHKALGPGVGLVDRLRDALTGRSHNV
jgi:hemerythrin superfamily protein